MGPAGPQGVEGPIGPVGPQGAIGPQGPEGVVTDEQIIAVVSKLLPQLLQIPEVSNIILRIVASAIMEQPCGNDMQRAVESFIRNFMFYLYDSSNQYCNDTREIQFV
jgi:hypothetical protein